jgi:membrane protein YqaA with SNARE-associated domain
MRIIRTISLGRWRDKLFRNAERIAEHRWAEGIVFLMELVGCTIFPLPNALTMVALVTAAPRKWLRFALGAVAGDLVAGVVLYAASRLFFQSFGLRLISFYQLTEKWASVVEWFQTGWGIAFIFLACITTGLFRVAGLAAGFTAMNPLLFLTVLTLSRGFRWVAECAAIKYVRDRVRSWPKHYYKYAAVGVGAGLLAFAVLVFVKLAA